jgi:FkbM family methyltransferase
MPITPEDVVAAYELILGRPPESIEALEAHLGAFGTRPALGQALLASTEFRPRAVLLAARDPVVAARLGIEGDDLDRLLSLLPERLPDPEPGFVVDAIGTRTRTAFQHDGPILDGRVFGLPLPADWHAEAAEWVAMLKAFLPVRGRFRMAELGAGWGPWSAAGHALARRAGITDIRLHAVEADPELFRRLGLHLADNGVADDEAVLHHAAIGLEPGIARWPAGLAPADYGARPVEGPGTDHRGHAVEETVEVPILPLPDLLAREEVWDLVHMDLQGLEERLCAAAMPTLLERVRQVLVATHSKALDAACFGLFHEAGWTCMIDLPPRIAQDRSKPNLEAMTTLDGTQLWRNPAL